LRRSAVSRVLRAATIPGQIAAGVWRTIGRLRARWLFRRCQVGERVSVQGKVRVVADGRVLIGDRVQFWEGIIATEIVCAPGAELSIGALTLFNYGTSVRAARSVQIGARCMFGSMVIVRDEAHGRVAPVTIGEDVWVAHGAIIEPGVTVGNGAVVAAGSVVVSDVPPAMLAIGNPAICRPLRPETSELNAPAEEAPAKGRAR
jgi:maltose O-acetyltransferase